MDGRSNAVELKRQGWHQSDIASALGVRSETVSRWLAQAHHGGVARRYGPIRHRATHPSSYPTRSDGSPSSSGYGAEADGFRSQVWTNARIALVIEEEFGVRYHKGHVGKLLQELHGTADAFPGNGNLLPAEDELRKLRAEILRLRAERDLLKKPPPTSPTRRTDIRVHRGKPGGMAGALDVRGPGGVGIRLLCLGCSAALESAEASRRVGDGVTVSRTPSCST
jgi:transposase